MVTGLWPHLQLLCVGLFWGARLRRSVSLASGRSLSLCFLAGVFLPWALIRTWVGRLQSCLSSCLLLGELFFPCPGFCLAIPAVWLSRLLVFSWNLYLGSFLSLPVFADGLGWLRLILGCPPSVAWRWRLLPGFFVRYLSACLVGLQCLWIPWSCGVPGLHDGVTCLRLGLCSSSVRDRDVCFPSFWRVLTIGLRAGSPASG